MWIHEIGETTKLLYFVFITAASNSGKESWACVQDICACVLQIAVLGPSVVSTNLNTSGDSWQLLDGVTPGRSVSCYMYFMECSS